MDAEYRSPEQQQTLEEIARRYHLSLILLFGSHATGRTTSESDVDIAVQTECPEKMSDLGYHLDLMAELASCLREGEIDLVFLNKADPLLKSEVGQHGKVLFEKEDAFADFAVRTMKEFEDARHYHFRILNEVLEDFYGSTARKNQRRARSKEAGEAERIPPRA